MIRSVHIAERERRDSGHKAPKQPSWLLFYALLLTTGMQLLPAARAQTNDCSCFRTVTNWHGTFTTRLTGSGVEDSGTTFQFNNSSQGSFDCTGRVGSTKVTGLGIVDRLEQSDCDFLRYQGSGPLTSPSLVSLFFISSNCTYYFQISEGLTVDAWQHLCQDPDPPLDLHNDVWYSPSHTVYGVFPLPEFGEPLIGSITTNVPWNNGFLTLNASWHIDPILDTDPPHFTSIPLGGPLGCNPTNIPDDVTVLGLTTATANSGHVGITVTHVDISTNVCSTNRVFTLTAVDQCLGTVAHAGVVYTWTTDTNPPSFTELPPGGSLGNNPASIPDDATIKSQVHVVDFCGGEVTLQVTHVDGGIAPQVIRTFTIVATDPCLNQATKTVVYNWTLIGLPPVAFTRSGGNLVLSWPSALTGVTLQTTSNLLAPTSWQTFPAQPTLAGDKFYVTNSLNNSVRFFRLYGQ